MSVIDEELGLKLRQQLKIVRHDSGCIKLRYRLGALGTLRQIESAAGRSLSDAIGGVQKIKVNPLLSTLTIYYDPATINPSWWETLLKKSDEEARRVLQLLQPA